MLYDTDISFIFWLAFINNTLRIINKWGDKLIIKYPLLTIIFSILTGSVTGFIYDSLDVMLHHTWHYVIVVYLIISNIGYITYITSI